VEHSDDAGAQHAFELGGESVAAAVDNGAGEKYVDDWIESNKYGK